jgi:hypothetical protein
MVMKKNLLFLSLLIFVIHYAYSEVVDQIIFTDYSTGYCTKKEYFYEQGNLVKINSTTTNSGVVSFTTEIFSYDEKLIKMIFANDYVYIVTRLNADNGNLIISEKYLNHDSVYQENIVEKKIDSENHIIESLYESSSLSFSTYEYFYYNYNDNKLRIKHFPFERSSIIRFNREGYYFDILKKGEIIGCMTNAKNNEFEEYQFFKIENRSNPIYSIKIYYKSGDCNFLVGIGK